jgi:hypothetical protein
MTEMDKSFIVEFSAGEVEFGPATADVWDGFLEHLRQRNRAAGELQLLMQCCKSLGVNPDTGVHDLEAYLEDEPAAIGEIANEIDSISGGDIEAQIDGRVVKCCGFTFQAPKRQRWDRYQEQLSDDKYRGGTASRELVTDMVDDKEGFRAFLKENPAAISSIVVQVSKLAGRGIRIKQKKVSTAGDKTGGI